MAKKRKKAAKPAPAPVPMGVTPERFVRLYRMVRLLNARPQTRETLARRLRLDVRGFYRDLDLLRTSGVAVALEKGQYMLTQQVEAALDLLPFPDPHLSLGQARTLAKGRGKAQRALAETIAHVLPS